MYRIACCGCVVGLSGLFSRMICKVPRGVQCSGRHDPRKNTGMRKKHMRKAKAAPAQAAPATTPAALRNEISSVELSRAAPKMIGGRPYYLRIMKIKRGDLERVMGIEPTSQAWEPDQPDHLRKRQIVCPLLPVGKLSA